MSRRPVRAGSTAGPVFVLLALLLSAPAGASAQSAPALSGGGSTFAAPLVKRWIEAYAAVLPGEAISYAPVGSSDGIAGFVDGRFDFAATDAPMSAEQEAAVTGGVAHVPVTAGMVAVAYNLPGALEGGLALPTEVLAGIFTGKITRWDDPALVAANPGTALPDSAIYLVARLDGSGTTYAFTQHLEAASPLWRESGRGAATRIGWGTAMLVRGNEGVANRVAMSEGSIGYVDYGTARAAGLDLASVENAAGALIAPSPEAGAAALATAELPDDLKISLPNPAGAAAYPIVTLSWMLVHGAADDAGKAAAVRAFATWGLADGQGYAPDLGFVPLPEAVRAEASLAVAPPIN